jgi:hypothetical protein
MLLGPVLSHWVTPTAGVSLLLTGVALWLVTFAGMTLRGLQLARAEQPPLRRGPIDQFSRSRRRAG